MLWSSALTTYCPGERSRFLAYFNGVGFTPAKVVSPPTTMEEVWTTIRAAEEATILRVHHPEELLAIAAGELRGRLLGGGAEDGQGSFCGLYSLASAEVE